MTFFFSLVNLYLDGQTAILKTMKITESGKKIKSFLKEVYLELKKVNWLNRRELFRYTLIIISVTLAVSFFLGGLDYIFTTLIKKFILYRGY